MRPLAIPIAIAAFLPAACSNATSEPEPQQETADPPVEMPTDSRAQTASPANQPAEAKISPVSRRSENFFCMAMTLARKWSVKATVLS